MTNIDTPWREIPIDTTNCHYAITWCGALSAEIERLRADAELAAEFTRGQRAEIERLRAINAKLVAALEWIAEDGATDARATECARTAIIQACAFCQENKGKMAPHHFASSRCESGKRNHCSCDICF